MFEAGDRLLGRGFPGSGVCVCVFFFFFFFNDTATTEIYTLSLHDALPISLLTLLCTVVMSFPLQSPDQSSVQSISIHLKGLF